MRDNKRFFYTLGVIASIANCTLITNVYAQSLKPTQEPIFNTPQARPNIQLILDDSASMDNRDIPAVAGGANIRRSEALKYAFENLFYKYRDKAYLGVSFLYQGNTSNGLIRLPLSDYSPLSEQEFKNKVIDPIGTLILSAPGHTPMYAGVYETFKMFRGYPVMQGQHASAWRGHHMEIILPHPLGSGNQRYFPATQLETPLRYRCQANHIILMTDGTPYGFDVWGVPDEDKVAFNAWKSYLGTSTYDRRFNGVELTLDIPFDGRSGEKNRPILGERMAGTDLRKAQKLTYKNGQWVTKILDDAGRDWNDELSVPMPLTVHSVSLYVERTSPIYTDLTAASKGMNLGFSQSEGGTAEDLLLAFDTIFASIIRSTSSSFALNDRTYADVLEGEPPMINGQIDTSKIGAIRYDTSYNFRQRFGTLRAIVPYIEITIDPVTKEKISKIKTREVWNSNETIKPNQGRYVTFIDSNQRGMEINELGSNATKKEFSSILQKRYKNPKMQYDQKYIQWLTNYKKAAEGGLRGRLNPLGSITNSDIQLVNRDELYINVLPEKMSANLRKGLINYLLYKAKFQPANFLIVADNDGFINFINGQRGLTGGRKGGERNTAYFPRMFANQLVEITEPNRNANIYLEGKTDIVDGEVYQQGVGDMYATIGLTSLGTGGKGIVGYRIFGASVKSVDSWSKNKQMPNTNPKILNEITPLFEINSDYDENSEYQLGYAYSDFEFFNRVISKNEQDQGQIVGIFGNGMSTSSIVYFMDAYTGKKLHEIKLPGTGAMSVATYAKNAGGNQGQSIDRLYVTDYEGSVYRIVFTDGDFTNDATTVVTQLFQVPQHEKSVYQSAISSKPLLIRNEKSGIFSLYFGTGVANHRERDRGDNSLVEHSIYGLIDNDGLGPQSSITVADLKAGNRTLIPLLTRNSLKEGRVDYENVANIDYNVKDNHALKITTPVNNANEGSSTGQKDGWYIRLIADGEKSGERLIQSPQYDVSYNAVVFSTWGISERDFSYKENGLYDPCIVDLAFGKSISVNAATGGGANTPRSNTGTTNTALGVPTGDKMLEAPSGNSKTDISSLDKVIEEELIEITGESESTHVTDSKAMGVYCYTSITNEVICGMDPRKKNNKVLEKGRVSVKTLFHQ